MSGHHFHIVMKTGHGLYLVCGNQLTGIIPARASFHGMRHQAFNVCERAFQTAPDFYGFYIHVLILHIRQW